MQNIANTTDMLNILNQNTITMLDIIILAFSIIFIAIGFVGATLLVYILFKNREPIDYDYDNKELK